MLIIANHLRAWPPLTMAIPGWLVGSRDVILLILLDAGFLDLCAAFFISPVQEALYFYFEPDCTRNSSQFSSQEWLSFHLHFHGTAMQMGWNVEFCTGEGRVAPFQDLSPHPFRLLGS